MSSLMTICLDDAIEKRLEILAEITHQSKTALALEAIQKYIDVNEWQIREIQTALKEADREEFASEEVVNTVFNKWS